MIKIKKNNGPNSLVQYKKKPKAMYDGDNFTTVKNDIRLSLLREQGYICAYCMRRIIDDNFKTKIEHWQPRSIYKGRQLDYSNLLACCDGGEGLPSANRTCDTKKSSSLIKYNPADSSFNINSIIKFKSSGKIESTDDDFNEQIDKVLNLNSSRLVKNRVIILEEVQKYLSNKPGRRTKSQIQSIISSWQKTTDGMHKEYYGVAIYDLNIRKQKAPQ